jgi:hypothetical protein
VPVETATCYDVRDPYAVMNEAHILRGVHKFAVGTVGSWGRYFEDTLVLEVVK